MLHITLDMAKQALEDAIALRGKDYAYKKPEGEPSCLYVHTDNEGNKTAGCGLGLALSRLGVPLEALEEQNRVQWHSLAIGGLTADYETDLLFGQFQLMQDHGRPWGYSYQAALSYAATFTE